MASAGGGSVDQCSSRNIAVFPATHSTPPTSLDTAPAPEAAPVGGYGVPENSSRRSPSSDVTDAYAAGSSAPRARVSARRATGETGDASRPRRVSGQGGGHPDTHAAAEKA